MWALAGVRRLRWQDSPGLESVLHLLMTVKQELVSLGDISNLTSSQTGSGHVALGLLPKSGRTFFSMRQKTPGRWRLSEAALCLLFVCMISLSEMPGGFMYGLA